METRIARLESDVSHIQRDVSEIKQEVRSLRDRLWSQFLITWGGIIALGIGLSGLMAKGFGWL